MQRVVPALRISSYSAALRFYQRLGFREKWTHRFDDGLPVFASIVRDGMEINLTEHTGDCSFGGLVHFYVDDVDELHRQFRDDKVPVKQAPANSLGPDIRDMLVVDPDGNRLSFLTVRPAIHSAEGQGLC
ncbi:MAG TPA: glyoxalase superfamily protein [Phycisphaerae bacterium]|nr:glyoxalase superfamily protein [Phycisphaerae bacterium]